MRQVVKIGGSVADLDPALRDIAASPDACVVVHGASRELNDLATRLGHPPRIVESGRGDVTRYTDSVAMDHFLMAYAGLRNKRIVERLRRLGRDAFGLTGLDGGVVSGRRRADLRIVEDGRPRVLHDNHAGSIERVDAAMLCALLERGCTPVLTPPIAAEDGTAINVDGDRLAAHIAVALGADSLVILSDTDGLLRDVDDPASPIADISHDDAGRFNGRARTKVQAALFAADAGVAAVVIAGAAVEHPLQRALAGSGTRVRGASLGSVAG